MQTAAPDAALSEALRKALKKVERMGVQNNFADVMLDFKVRFLNLSPHLQDVLTRYFWYTLHARRADYERRRVVHEP